MKIGKINCISIVKNAYVLPLEHVDQPPEKLFYAGTLPQKRQPTVAIIGSRTPTPYGIEMTRKFATALAKSGVCVISGLAYGIDSIAHEAALQAGGVTIAVLAGGLHAIYPSRHTGLAERIVQNGGALISEKPRGYDARKYDFLARNRLISGLADAILVPEAAERSGTVSTINHALDQGVDVFVIPGPLTSPLSAGTNRTLQQGAYVALTPNDILLRVAPEKLTKKSQTALPLGDDERETAIIAQLALAAQTQQDLIDQLDVPPPEILSTLTLLELKGIVYRPTDDHWALRPY